MEKTIPGAGTDKTRNWIETPGPIIVLVEPQLGENIGAAARVMANFGLGRLRLVRPRDGWPNIQAQRSASGADRILADGELAARLGQAGRARAQAEFRIDKMVRSYTELYWQVLADGARD